MTAGPNATLAARANAGLRTSSVVGSPGPDRTADALRFVRARDPWTGFAEAVGHLMTRPAFARAPFGHIARMLAGQAGRGHYAFVKRGPRIVGFAGWALTDEARAEAWLAGARVLDDADARAGDCALLNVWQADDAAVSRFILARLGDALGGCRLLYAKRHYPDGRMRPVRLAIARRTIAATRGDETTDKRF